MKSLFLLHTFSNRRDVSVSGFIICLLVRRSGCLCMFVSSPAQPKDTDPKFGRNFPIEHVHKFLEEVTLGVANQEKLCTHAKEA